MTAKIDLLIDKQDSNEIVRDQIAALLRIEIDNQKSLAIAAGKDVELFDFDVYTEKLKPWEVLTTGEGDDLSETPLINVLFDNDTFDNKNSEEISRQRTRGTFFIDCYTHKNKTKNMTSDEASSREADRIARLVRNIIMSAKYYQLGLGHGDLGIGNNIVFSRKIIKREKFLPSDREGVYFEQIVATRLTMEVMYDEFAPQVATGDLELFYMKCTKADDGKIYFETLSNMT
jgi:hypothetical protein